MPSKSLQKQLSKGTATVIGGCNTEVWHFSTQLRGQVRKFGFPGSEIAGITKPAITGTSAMY